jgi:hypothetical protein
MENNLKGVTIDEYLNLQDYHPVSSKEFANKFGLETIGTNPEEGKKIAFEDFVDRVVDTVSSYQDNDEFEGISIGFSDDDISNVEVVEKLIEEKLKQKYPFVNYLYLYKKIIIIIKYIMKIKKNGKVINLTESDLKRIVKRVLTEQDTSIANELEEYNVAVAFCDKVQEWWKGSSNWFFNPENMYGKDTDYVKFFKPYNEDGDDDAAAGNAYYHFAIDKLKKEVDMDNKHYKDIEGWINCIVEEIPEYMQHNCSVTIYGPNGKTDYFTVDPEIDV